MSSITGWNRIEPVARDQSFREGLESPIYDPAWTLARQWQIGEFQGEDAGSAVLARVAMRARPVTHYRPGPPGSAAAPVALDEARPLEALVETETAADFGATGWFDRSEAGLHFLRLLAIHPALPEERAGWINSHGFPSLPADAVLSADLLADYAELRGTSPDGLALSVLLPALLDGSAPVPQAYAATADALREVAGRWLVHWHAVFATAAAAEGAWQSNRMEYAFSLAAGGAGAPDNAALEVSEFHGGRLDWYDFDVRPAAGFGAGDLQETTIARVPMPVDFAGMPAPRWWEFEDARFALPQIEAAPDDLIKLVLVDFALVYGGDWLMVPVELAVSSVHRIGGLTVTDTFGQDIAVAAQDTADPLQAWTMHHLATAGATLAPQSGLGGQVLFVPPAGPGIQDGPARETVEFGRDEIANLVLARERTITAPDGSAEDREQAYRMRARPAPAPDADPMPEFHLAEPVPDYWIPFVAEAAGDNTSIRLRRGAFLDTATGERVRARGRLLVPEQKLRLEEEEVSRIGMTLTRRFRLARSADGTTVLWPARTRRTSKGEGSNDVRFDRLTGGTRDDG